MFNINFAGSSSGSRPQNQSVSKHAEPETLSQQQQKADVRTKRHGYKSPSKGKSSKQKGANNCNNGSQAGNNKKKRSRRRRKPKTSKVEPLPKKQHDAPMTKKDLYFALNCELVGIPGGHAVARVTLVNWELEVLLDTFVQVPVPVTAFFQTGIRPEDVHTSNPDAMPFCEVRQIVEHILRGKILIGHALPEHLNALGLTHPQTDVRDTGRYFQSTSRNNIQEYQHGGRSDLGELAIEYLKRPLPNPGARSRPLESCIAALDLYKTHRREWEESLISRRQQQERKVSYASPSRIDQATFQSQNMGTPLRPRVSSYDEYTIPLDHSVQGHRYDSIPNPQQIASSAPADSSYVQQDRQASGSSSSWFTFGRKERTSQAQYNPSQITNAPALSSQALEVLTSHYDHHYDSSTLDGSTNYEASTDYGSSAHYDGSSVVSDSVATESIASSLHEQDVTGIEPAYDTDFSEKQNASSSSWKWFGSRSKSARGYNAQSHHHHREPTMMAVFEEGPEEPSMDFKSSNFSAVTEEPTSSTLTEEAAPVTTSTPKSMQAESQTSTKNSSSKWFGFRRTKSPSGSKRDKGSRDELRSFEEYDDLPAEAGEWRLQNQEEPPPLQELKNFPETNSNTSEEQIVEKQNSSWFRLRRSSKRRGSNDREILVDEPVSQATDSTEATNDEEWLREVMNQPGNQDLLESYKESMKDKNADLEDTTEKSANENDLGKKPVIDTASTNHNQQSNWFRFLRSPKSNSRKISRLPAAASEDADDEFEPAGNEDEDQTRMRLPSASTVSFDDGNPSRIHDDATPGNRVWFENTVTQPAENPKFSPSWYGLSDREVEIPPDAPRIEMPSGAAGEVGFFMRARLPTDSTIPSIAADFGEEDEEDNLSQDILLGMEQNFSFLNI